MISNAGAAQRTARKVLQWANEARRLNALELREYVTPRRQTLLLAMIRHARGQVLDDLTQMLLRLVRKVEWKASNASKNGCGKTMPPSG
jgi:hypothetical protein